MTLRNAGHDLDEIALRARLGGVNSASAIVLNADDLEK
jgi:hypothetical protein